jgi:hypothetical protein
MTPHSLTTKAVQNHAGMDSGVFAARPATDTDDAVAKIEQQQNTGMASWWGGRPT